MDTESPDTGTFDESWDQRKDRLCDQFEDAWRQGQQPKIEDYLADLVEPKRSELLGDLLAVELEFLCASGKRPVFDEYERRFPEQVSLVRAAFFDAGCLPPERIGRYKVCRRLGGGGFGQVYLCYDDTAERYVAIKLPRSDKLTSADARQGFLRELRNVARLDHEGIVPLYDFGEADGKCYLVCRFIEGSTLAERRRQESPLPAGQAARIIARIADALRYAHGERLYHRDIKPANILLDRQEQAYLTDFGLAVREEELPRERGRRSGTYPYMSPEMVRGEGHRIDGRTDIYSLGVVLYELLCGRPPFSGSKSEVFDQILRRDPPPPREINDKIHPELERICLKAIAKQKNARYLTAGDMALDLRAAATATAAAKPRPELGSDLETVTHTPDTPESGPATTTPPPAPGSVPVVPKGLRSFDAHDADFFLELLPGPRDRDGLPDSIRFWKRRIEETDPDNTFSVGLIYGPSGCGKSSLVKAGLLPRLSDAVIKVYLEATANDTEGRLLNRLRKHCSALPINLGLKESLAALRRGQGIPAGKKVLIVLDQFEQWLHGWRAEEETELVQALRQCDGARVKCIVMVRDDFWMATTRFMRESEIDLLPGQNIAAVDLFDPRHASTVLTAFGRAFGALPKPPAEPTKEQKSFVERAVSGLAQDGKIICIRLALFAEMMKGKPWTSASLKEDVGVTFLEETFSSPAANPKHRLHQVAARSVLKALLPESGTDIKGHRRSYAEVLEASGYTGRPKDFDDLIHILDSEIRLITPTDLEGNVADGDSHFPIQAGQKYYQLTHDYLVYSLRDWLSRKQKETRRGRAELLLRDRASVWNARLESRQLPSFPQWVNLHLLTQKRKWTQPEKKMMRKANRYHGLRAGVLAAFVLLAGWGLWEGFGYLGARHRVGQLIAADTVGVERYLEELLPYRRWAKPQLRQLVAEGEDAKTRLHAALALVDADPTQLINRRQHFIDALLHARPEQLMVLRTLLESHTAELAPPLWEVLRNVNEPAETRLRAAGALAAYTPLHPHWPSLARDVIRWLMREDLFHLPAWNRVFQPAGTVLMQPLAEVFHNAKASESDRTTAALFLADYAADQPTVLADLLMDADEKQFAVLFPKFKAQGEQGLPVLSAEVGRKLAPDAKDDEKEKLAKRQANAAAALLKMDRPTRVWPLLKHSRDPTLRSYLIHRLGPLGIDVKVVLERLKGDNEPDITIRRALLLSLGEFSEQEFAPGERDSLVKELCELYRDAPDPGLHGAVEWLLRQWKQEQWLKQMEQEWAKDKRQRDDRVRDIRRQLASRVAEAPGEAQGPLWYVDRQGQTMVVIPDPARFQMGSPETEAGRLPDEPLQKPQVIGRTFAIAAKSVTLEQFLRFPKAHAYVPRFTPAPECPVNWMRWSMVPEYCNWLSKEEGLPEQEWCYKPNEDGKYQGAMKLAPDYLKRTGYRLPTEAEWECTCRAGALTSRHYGESINLLEKYAWYVFNSDYQTRPVGSLKPNDWGLFDMHGNVWTWCHEDGANVAETELHPIIRGGAFGDAPQEVRAACRFLITPERITTYVGLRPARTFR